MEFFMQYYIRKLWLEYSIINTSYYIHRVLKFADFKVINYVSFWSVHVYKDWSRKHLTFGQNGQKIGFIFNFSSEYPGELKCVHFSA